MPHNSHNSQNTGATVGLSNGVLSTNGGTGIGGTSTTTGSSSPGDDLGSTDEVKVFKDEGEQENEEISSQTLLEEKSSLIDLTESEVSHVPPNAHNKTIRSILYSLYTCSHVRMIKNSPFFFRIKAGNHNQDKSRVQYLVRIKT